MTQQYFDLTKKSINQHMEKKQYFICNVEDFMKYMV